MAVCSFHLLPASLAPPKPQFRRGSPSQRVRSTINGGEAPKPVDGFGRRPLSRWERKKKSEEEIEEDDLEYEEEDDGPYDETGLVCCFGALQMDFVPSVRVCEYPEHPDIYSQWKKLHWEPPEFARAPGGPPSNVAIALARLGGRPALIGKVGQDPLGFHLIESLNKERVQTRGVLIDPLYATACTEMKLKVEDGKFRMETAKPPAEGALTPSELNLAILKEARMFHFCSEALTSPVMEASLYKAIKFFKKSGGLVFFDLNMPLPLWKSRDETRELITKAWNEADVIEVSREELEFLLDEDYYKFRKDYKNQYFAENYVRSKKWRDYYHYTRDEISPLWHDGLKFLFVTDGTIRIHYYTPDFDGEIVGTEDVLITPMTCDRTGSGDAMVAAIMRKLTTHPEMFDNQDVLERQLRFVVAAGIIAQWTIGATRGLPTESASQNLKEQVYVPSMW